MPMSSSLKAKEDDPGIKMVQSVFRYLYGEEHYNSNIDKSNDANFTKHYKSNDTMPMSSSLKAKEDDPGINMVQSVFRYLYGEEHYNSNIDNNKGNFTEHYKSNDANFTKHYKSNDANFIVIEKKKTSKSPDNSSSNNYKSPPPPTASRHNNNNNNNRKNLAGRNGDDNSHDGEDEDYQPQSPQSTRNVIMSGHGGHYNDNFGSNKYNSNRGDNSNNNVNNSGEFHIGNNVYNFIHL